MEYKTPKEIADFCKDEKDKEVKKPTYLFKELIIEAGRYQNELKKIIVLQDKMMSNFKKIKNNYSINPKDGKG